MLREVRNIATWVSMSCMLVLLTNDMVKRSFMSAEVGVVLFVLTLFGVWVAALSQFGIWAGWIINSFSKARAIDRLSSIGSAREKWLN